MNQDHSEVSGGGNRVPGDAEVRKQIAEEHRLLGELVERTEATTDPHALLPVLEELQRLLQEHFRREEDADGLHDMVGEAAPHKLTAVQRLFDEHRDLAAHLDAAIRHTREVIDGPVAQVRSEVGELAEKLRAHEAAENELVAGALYEDLGFSS